MRYEKRYVGMKIYVGEEGGTRPLAVCADGRDYEVDRVLCVRNVPPEHVGGVLTERYDVVVCGRRRALYRDTEDGRWFTELPLPDDGA